MVLSVKTAGYNKSQKALTSENAEIFERAGNACYSSDLHITDTDQEKAIMLVNGIYNFKNKYDVAVDYAKADFTVPDDFTKPLETSLRFNFHSFRWMDPLRRQFVATREAKYLQKIDAFISAWSDQNGTPPLDNMPSSHDPGDYTWYDMSTAWRTTFLACILPETTRYHQVIDLLTSHKEVLKLQSFYAGKGNHALHHNNALLLSSYVLDDPSGIELAQSRTENLIKNELDEEGVSLEGSPTYQALNMDWWMETAVLYKRISLDLPFADRISKMTDFVLYSLDWQQQFMLFGDSARKNKKFSRDAQWAYSPSMNESLENDENVRILYKGDLSDELNLDKTRLFREGWGFSRKSWSPQNFCEHSTLAIKGGGSIKTRVHGHEDHGSFIFYANNSRVFDDSGLFAYYGGEKRLYVRSNEAHNSIVIDGAKYYASADADLELLSTNENVDMFSADIRTTQQTRWNRQVVHLKTTNSLIISDIVNTALENSIHQHLQLGDDYRAEILTDNRVLAIHQKTDVKYLIEFLHMGKAAVINGQTEPLLGWRSSYEGELHPIDTIVYTLDDKLKTKSTIIVTPVTEAPEGSIVYYTRFSTSDTRIKFKHNDGVVDITFGRNGVTGYSQSSNPCVFDTSC